MATEMVKDHITLSIVECVVAVSAGNPVEYIRAVALLSMMGIKYGSGVPILVMIHVLERGLRSQR